MNNTISFRVIGIMTMPERKLNEIELKIGVAVNSDVIEVGRKPVETPNVMLDYAGVSRRQARLKIQDEVMFVEDMGSDNGTWVILEDEFKLAESGKPIEVNKGMRILFGTIVAEIL